MEPSWSESAREEEAGRSARHKTHRHAFRIQPAREVARSFIFTAHERTVMSGVTMTMSQAGELFVHIVFAKVS